MKVSYSLVASTLSPLENSLSISHNVSKSCHHYTAVQLWQKQFFSIDPKVERGGYFWVALLCRAGSTLSLGFRALALDFEPGST